MRRFGPVLLALLLVACGTRAPTAMNRWADERLWPVLEAQERRDVPGLCTLMKSEDTHVREAAALAFASVHDAAAIPCLLHALADDSASVRGTAAFALGFIADSATVGSMAEIAMAERDTVVQRALLRASFIAMQRNGMLRDANAILYYLDRATGHEAARAADALRRLPDSTVQHAAMEIHDRMGRQSTDARQFLIAAMRKMGEHARRSSLGRIAWENPRENERVSALRAYGALYREPEAVDVLLGGMGGPAENAAALEALGTFERLEAHRLGWHARQTGDTLMRIGLLGLMLKHGDNEVADSARAVLRAIADAAQNPYVRAAVIAAKAMSPEAEDMTACMAIVRSDAHPAERQAAFQGAVTGARAIMMRSRYASREAQLAALRGIVQDALSTDDAGLICAVAELLQAEEADAIRILLPKEWEQRALTTLQPIRDLEARLLLAQAAAKRDGLPSPAPALPGFNHPINKDKLRALKQGQRYRIVTSKGDVVIATDVDECPGSSLAFDSLVTAGYYDGKAFHRVVPGFVIQGGCPRGDGYGGMPWTLRTEIARKPFAAGAVGLASAGRDTESCQFFITQGAAPHLDGRYTRFGEVVEGMEVVWRVAVGDRIVRARRMD